MSGQATQSTQNAQGTQASQNSQASPAPAGQATESSIISQSHGQEDFGVTPEVVLFVGAAVLTVALMALVIPFLVRKMRQEDQARSSRGDA